MTAVVFNNTVLRDGHQSMAATRMRTSQMLAVAPMLDRMGFGLLETWGGASIDACLRFLGEQPFDRIRALRKAAPGTPQSMLLRGQNIVQYASFPDDVVTAFVGATAAAGMHTFRIFDALNDARNVATSIAAVRAAGGHARGEICYTTSPVHTPDVFVAYAKELKEMGCDSLAVKDMAGIIVPRVAADLVSRMKKATGLPVTLHSHDTAGLAASSYLAAIDAGADAVETSISPFANGTSQPDTLRMLALLDGHPRCPDYDRKGLAELREAFTEIYAELHDFTSHANEVVESDTLIYQVPGGMLSNFRVQLRELKMDVRASEVLAEIPVVREALGWPPLVTPISQIVGTQAMLNVKFGRWKNFSPQAMDIALGNYGKTPGVIDPGVLAIAEKNTGRKRLDSRPADALAPRMPELRKELASKNLPVDDESCVLYAMFPREFAQLHAQKSPAPAAPPAAAATVQAPPAPAPPPHSTHGSATRFRMTIDGTPSEIIIEELH